MKHTQGPWKRTGMRIYRETLHGNRVATVESAKLPPEESEANARLIAAAPDLLAALKWAMGSHRYSARTTTNEAYCNAVDRANSAIAKAEGRG
jgi:hypothetical protein